jgi:16S rRNA (uracil1498-N3)-methyltransferase
VREVRAPVTGLSTGAWSLPQAAAHHVARVLRRVVGDEVLLFDGAARLEALARIDAIEDGRVSVTVRELRPARVQSAREVVLVQALGKGDRFDQIVRDATELGATRIIPLLTRRTVVKPGERGARKAERWRTIATEAARQSGRGDTPVLDEITTLADLSRSVHVDHPLVLSPRATLPAGAAILGQTGSLALVVGPEGGLDEDEVDQLAAAGWTPVTLGPRILRTETVAAALLGALLLLDPAPG